MNLIGRLVVVGALSLGVIASAEATCTKPIGTYAGVFSGAYLAYTGAWYSQTAELISIVVASDGSGTVTETGKTITGTASTSGRTTSSSTFTAANNSFNSSVCQGIITTLSGKVWIYASVNSGNDVRVAQYTNDTNLVLGIALLSKV